jgi:hypothetical protein
MKTSNKLLVGTGICIVLGIFSFAFMMRGAYQKALAAPILSEEVSIDLKPIKFLNIDFEGSLNFVHGDKYEIKIQRDYKDSLSLNYQGDTLILDATKIGKITFISPQIPVLKSYSTDNDDVQTEREYNDDDDEIYNIEISVDSVLTGSFIANIQEVCSVNLFKCNLDKVEIKNQEYYSRFTFDQSKIKQLNMKLPLYATLHFDYSQIQSKNVILGDSCEVFITGKQSHSSFLK